MPTIEFTIYGDPKPKKRHRSRVIKSKFGKPYAMTYPDPDGVSEENYIKLAASQNFKEPIITGPIELELSFGCRVPKSWSKKKQDEVTNGFIKHTSKPDLDNLIKCVKDALNGVVWLDDSQVHNIIASKFYIHKPQTYIKIEY